jgi:hypothetical protein
MDKECYLSTLCRSSQTTMGQANYDPLFSCPCKTAFVGLWWTEMDLQTSSVAEASCKRAKTKPSWWFTALIVVFDRVEWQLSVGRWHVYRTRRWLVSLRNSHFLLQSKLLSHTKFGTKYELYQWGLQGSSELKRVFSISFQRY